MIPMQPREPRERKIDLLPRQLQSSNKTSKVEIDDLMTRYRTMCHDLDKDIKEAAAKIKQDLKTKIQQPIMSQLQ